MLQRAFSCEVGKLCHSKQCRQSQVEVARQRIGVAVSALMEVGADMIPTVLMQSIVLRMNIYVLRYTKVHGSAIKSS